MKVIRVNDRQPLDLPDDTRCVQAPPNMRSHGAEVTIDQDGYASVTYLHCSGDHRHAAPFVHRLCDVVPGGKLLIETDPKSATWTLFEVPRPEPSTITLRKSYPWGDQ